MNDIRDAMTYILDNIEYSSKIIFHIDYDRYQMIEILAFHQ